MSGRVRLMSGALRRYADGDGYTGPRLFPEGAVIEVLKQPRCYLIMALKMVITPAVILLLLKVSGVTGWVEDGRTLVYISFMAVITPCAVTVTQLAQIHRNRAAYAGALNALTTLISLVTMPLMTGFYYLLM